MKHSDRDSEISNTSGDAPLGNVLAVVNCLRILGHVDAFSGWLNKYHHLDRNDDFFEGYKFAFDVLLGRLFDEIGYNRSLNLSEDMVLSRALFAGIPISKVPNTCEKAILLRNVDFEAKSILSAHGWEELIRCSKAFDDKVLSCLGDLQKITTTSPAYLVENVEEAIRYASIFEVYIFLNDTSRGRPHGLPLSWYDKEVPLFWQYRGKGKAYLEQVFKGYKYAIQFLWYRLLKDSYNSSILVRLNEAQNWREFDQFFEKIRESVVVPLEKKTKATLGFDSILLINLSAKEILGRLIQSGPPENRLTKKDSLDRSFFWYEIELIDASDFGFNGVASFVPILVGSAHMRKERHLIDKINVIRLVHPPEGASDRRDFSYGILINVGSATGLADYSGWLLFYNCCSDKGSTSPGYEFVESWLNRYSTEGTIEIEQVSVGKKQFLRLMKHRLISMTKEEMFNLEQSRQK